VEYLERRLQEMADETKNEQDALRSLMRRVDDAKARIAFLDEQTAHYQAVLEMERQGGSAQLLPATSLNESVTANAGGTVVERRRSTTDVREELEAMLSDGEPRSMNDIMDHLDQNLGRPVSRSTVRTVLIRMPNVTTIGRGVFRLMSGSLVNNGEQPSQVS
jgi:hypothetical protein